MFRLIISPRVQRQFKSIKQNHQLAVKLAILDIKENPTIGKSLTRELKGKLSYRVADYRIIYKVNEKDKIVYVLTAGQRGEVYK